MENATYLELPGSRSIAYHKVAADGEHASRPGLIFLSGYRSDMQGTKARYLHDWAAARGFGYIRFDYTGHGQSSGRFEDGCIGDWADDAAQVLTQLGSGRHVLIGSSMGGWIALLLARRFPERIAGIVGLAAAPDFTADALPARLGATGLDTIEREGRIAVPSRYSDEPYVYTRRLLQDGARHLVLRSTLRIDVPVRLLHGTADPDVDPEVAHRLLAHIECPDAALTLIKDGDHRLSDPRSLRHVTAAVEEVMEAAASRAGGADDLH